MRIPEIVNAPVTDGFIRGGREVPFGVDEWRGDDVQHKQEPCDAGGSYPNAQKWCDDELVDFPAGDPLPEKTGVETVVSLPFNSWTMHHEEYCERTDIVLDADKARVAKHLENITSALFAQELSLGSYSGNPSFRSIGVAVTDTAYAPKDAVARLLDARVDNLVVGPHIIHAPIALKPFFDDLNIASNDTYRVVYDAYVKSFDPVQNTIAGGATTAPTSSQAWIAITGQYEYATDGASTEETVTIDARTANTSFIQAEKKAFYHLDTCGIFLAKVTVFA